MHRLKLAVSYSYQNKNFAGGNTKENLQLMITFAKSLRTFAFYLKLQHWLLKFDLGKELRLSFKMNSDALQYCEAISSLGKYGKSVS